jgi:hypothetical protein
MALSGWFCVQAETLPATARWVKQPVIFSAAMSFGCFFPQFRIAHEILACYEICTIAPWMC